MGAAGMNKNLSSLTDQEREKAEIETAMRMNPLYVNIFGWNPFNCDPASLEFYMKVKEVQERWAKAAKDVIVDGILGPVFRGILQGRDYSPRATDHFIIGGEKVYAKGIKIIDYTELNGYDTALSFANFGALKRRTQYQTILRATIHWDVCLSSISCFHILANSGKSTHFGVNFDGDWYEFADPLVWVATHNGDDNSHSIGIDVNNPVLMKYLDKTVAQRNSRRILHKEDYPGFGSGEFMGPTEAQVESLKIGLPILCDALNIPFVAPGEGERWDAIDNIKSNGNRVGIFCHLNYPISRRKHGKWDFLGFPWDEIVR